MICDIRHYCLVFQSPWNTFNLNIIKTEQQECHMPKYSPTKTELANGWLKLKGCMLQTFAHHLWLKHFKPADGDIKDNPFHEDCHIVERGILASVLMNIRIINDFFDDKGYDTDIKASHYLTFKNPGRFLLEEEDRSINKHIAHLTKERVSVPSAGWSPRDLIIRANKPFQTFGSFIEGHFLKGQIQIKALATHDFQKIKTLVSEVEDDYGAK